jgi:hypothetical protein
MSKLLETTRVPGFMSRMVGRSFTLRPGSRNIVTTVALEKSLAKMSAFTNVALPVTPAAAAFRFDSSTMSGLNSMPSAVAPSLAAVMTVRPSPEPRSTTKSCGVTLAIASILSTSVCGVGTQITSLPAWPTCGWNSPAGCANAPPNVALSANANTAKKRGMHLDDGISISDSCSRHRRAPPLHDKGVAALWHQAREGSRRH